MPLNQRMESIEEYKNRRKEWESSQFSFRGNIANKETIKAFKEANKFANEGEALDYIVQTFEQSNKLTEMLSLQLAEKNAAFEILQRDSRNEIISLNVKLAKHPTLEPDQRDEQIKKLQEELKQANDFKFVPGENFIKLKEITEKILPALFSIEVAQIPTTGNEFLNLLVEYCERDPSNEFPFQAEAEKIINRWRAEQAASPLQTEANEHR
jgi:hypothetical protein